MKSTILKLIAIAAVFALLVGTATAATTFAVSDFTTNNPYFSADLSVDENDAPFGRVSVALVPEEKEGLDTTGYSITESAAGPGDWDTMLPVEYLFSAMPAPGEIQLHAWVRYEDSGVPSYDGPFSDWIVYSTETSQPYNIVITPDAYSIDLSWDTDEAAIGWVEYREAGSGTWLLSEPGLYGLQTVITITGLTEETDYELVLHSNSVVIDELNAEPIVITTTPPTPTQDNVSWSGALTPELGWSVGRNWVGMYPPANPTAGTIEFTATGATTGASTVTSALDPENCPGAAGELLDRWEIAGITMDIPNLYHRVSMYDAVNEVEKTLLINDSFTLRRGNFVPAGGTFGFDTAAVVRIGDNSNIQQSGTARRAVLSLAESKLMNNTLHVDDLALGWIGSYFGGEGRIVIKPATGMTKLQVDTYFGLGTRLVGVHGASFGYMGDDANSWKLPAGIDVQFGTDLTACEIEVANRGGDRERQGIMRTTSGGALTLNVSSLEVAAWRSGYIQGGWREGILDLSTMDSCSGSIGTLRVATTYGSLSSTISMKGILGLPPGAVTVGTAVIGDSYVNNTDNYGRLILNGTKMTVNTNLSLHKSGQVQTTVNGTSCGLDIAAGATVTFDQGSIHIDFAAEQDAGETGEYWGLRWAGDHRTALFALDDAGKLTSTIADGLAGSVGIAYDGTYTYVSLKEVWPPTIVTKDVTVEVMTEDPTDIVIDAKDIDALAHLTTVTRAISHALDTDANPETVTLNVTGAGTYELTLTLTAIEGGGVASDTATLTVVVVPDPSAADLTWSGDASLLVGMDRPEWLWGQNWVGGAAPVNPTNAILTFANDGSGASELDADRTVRYLQFASNAKKHTIDLAGFTLLIAGQDEAELPLSGQLRFSHAASTAEAEITNGLLQIGTADAPSDILMSSGTIRNSNLKIFSNLQLYARNIEVSRFTTNVDVLDLRGATLVDGVLRAQNLLIGSSAENDNAQLMLSETMNLQELAVSGQLCIGYGTYSRGRIGVPTENPDDDWDLPSGTNVTIGALPVPPEGEDPGSPGVRGSLWVGRSGYSWNRGYLGGAAGGEFNAYLSFLRVGTTRDQGSPTAVLDLRQMASCDIDTNEISIGSYVAPNPPFAGRSINARVYLTTGTVATGVLRLDHEVVSSDTSVSLLELNDTLLTVGTSVTMGPHSQIEANVGSDPSGLDLADGATISMADGSVISIFFNDEPSGTQIHWGMRLVGDRVTDLEALAAADKLVWDDTGMSPDAAIFFQDGYTYVGVQGVTITEFAVTGDTGSSLFTRTAEVDVVLDAVSYVGTVDGWQITEIDEEPTTWLGASPTTYEIQAEPGMVELFGWVKDDQGNVARTSASILYEPTNVVISNVVMTDNEDGTVSITWDTNVAAFGKIDYKLYFDTEWIATPFVGPVTSHSGVMVLQGLIDEQHDIIITSNATTLETQWPVDEVVYPEGDANEDCMVDLRDLVYVRNRLFETVTPENETADVNGDDSIDLEDLIVVRNNLGAVCEEPE